MPSVTNYIGDVIFCSQQDIDFPEPAVSLILPFEFLYILNDFPLVIIYTHMKQSKNSGKITTYNTIRLSIFINQVEIFLVPAEEKLKISSTIFLGRLLEDVEKKAREISQYLKWIF